MPLRHKQSTFRSQVRLQVARILASTNITDAEGIRGISGAFEALTEKPDEISLELQVQNIIQWYSTVLPDKVI